MKIAKPFKRIAWAAFSALAFVVSVFADGGDTDLHKVTLTFMSMGKEVDTKEVSDDGLVGELPSVSESGYEFIGWFDASGQQIFDDTLVDELAGTTITAEWSAPITYRITYKDGSNVIQGLHPDTYNVTDETVVLPTDAPKSGCAFKGWYDNISLEGDPIEQFDATDCEDKMFYAKYELVAYLLWIGGVQFTAGNLVIDADDDPGIASGTATYDPESNTLWLTNFVYSGPGLLTNFIHSALYYEAHSPDFVIEVSGTNRLALVGAGGYSFGLDFRRGNGQDQTTVTIRSADGGRLSVAADAANYSYGIFAAGADLVIDGAAVSAVGGGPGLYCSFGANLDWCRLTIKSGSLAAKGGKATNYDSVGVFFSSSRESLFVKGGSLIATGGEAGRASYGIQGRDSSGTPLSFTGGETLAQGGTAGIAYASLSVSDGLAVFAGADADGAAAVEGDGWKNQKCVRVAAAPPAVAATVTFNNGSGAVVYDGQGHGVEVAVTDPAEGAAVLFALGDSSGPTNTWSSTAPMFTNACKETVWVELSAVGYKTVTNSVAVVIELRDIAEASVSSVPPRTYQYVPLQPEPASVQYNGLQLAAAVDYTLSWVSNDAPGTAAVLLVGQGNYKGTNRQEFAILPTVTASLKWKYAKDENGRFYAQVAIPWYAGYNDAISNMRLLFDDRYYKYGASLDEEQTAFFRISSMMDMKDENGNLYYMNAKTGDIYTEEFLQSGYKEVLRAGAAMGDPNYLNGKQVGSSSSFVSEKPTHYFDEQGAINREGTGFHDGVIVDGQNVQVKLSTTQGQVVAYLVDPATEADPPWGREDRSRNYRAAPIEISSFAGLDGGERAAFGVSDSTMTNAPAFVPAEERKICLKIVDRDITAMEAIDNTNATLAWDEGGETFTFPLIAEVPWPFISNVATTQRVDGVIGVDFSFDVANSPELFCEEGIQPVFCISVMDNATGSNFVASAEALSGDVGTEAGSHIVTWDMDAQGFYLLPTNFTFWVSYVKNPVGTVFDPAGDAIGESFAWRPQSGFFSSMFTGVAIKPPPPVVSNVVARQRWPWNGLVDVDYDVDVRTTDVLVEIDIDEQGGLSRHWTATNFLAGAEPTLNRGYNRATWDAKAAGATNVVTEVQATVKLLHEE